MSSFDPYLSATELAMRIRRREISPVTVVEDCLERIEDRNDATNAFVTTISESARNRAKEAEKRLNRGEPVGPLHGVPIAIKDLFDFKSGVRNTIGSKPFAEFVPETTATYVHRLEEAGAIVVGKTNVPEFGHKGTTDNALFGATSTPFDLDMNAGGSSGGSAAAVADGLVPVAQGTDGGGSIRIPAALCGVFGFKPSYGRVAQEVRPDGFASHTPLIHAGPLTRTVDDAALMLDVMTGPSPRDPLSVPDDNIDFQAAVGRGVDGLDIAYSPDFGLFPVEDQVSAIVHKAANTFDEAGATVEKASPEFEDSRETLREVWFREIGGQYHSVLQGFEKAGIDLLENYRTEIAPEFLDLLERTKDMTVREYKRDEHIRTRTFDAIQDLFEGYDLLVTPTVGVEAIPNATDGQTVGPSSINGVPVDPLIGWSLAYPINFTGHPAASVPAGRTSADNPVGMQIIGRRYRDGAVLAASGAIERSRSWHNMYPPR